MNIQNKKQHIIVRLMKTKSEEKLLKAAKDKLQLTYWEKTI